MFLASFLIICYVENKKRTIIMATYIYRAFNNIGNIHSGSIQATSKEDALNLLRIKQLTPVSMNENSEENNAGNINKVRIKSNAVLVFTRQLLSLIKAGIPLTESLELIIDQATDSNMREIIIEIHGQIRIGKRFSDSLGRYPNIFTELYVNSIRIAESAGNFEQILQNLEAQLKNDMQVKKEIRKALSYPSFLVGAIILAFVVFTTYIFPKFLPFFEKSSAPLPYPTKIVIFIAGIFNSYGLLILFSLVIAGFIYYTYDKTEKGKYRTHQYLLKLPFIGNLIKKISSQRFCKTVSILIGQGIPLIQAMDIAIKAESNLVFREKIIKVQQKVENGQSITSALKTINIFPKVMIHMISVGEVTGALEQMMDKVSEFYQLEITTTTETITSLIEPLITILLAVVVLFLALSIFLPMWNMMGIAN
jgi:type II secretory pathway component PulF